MEDGIASDSSSSFFLAPRQNTIPHSSRHHARKLSPCASPLLFSISGVARLITQRFRSAATNLLTSSYHHPTPHHRWSFNGPRLELSSSLKNRIRISIDGTSNGFLRRGSRPTRPKSISSFAIIFTAGNRCCKCRPPPGRNQTYAFHMSHLHEDLLTCLQVLPSAPRPETDNSPTRAEDAPMS